MFLVFYTITVGDIPISLVSRSGLFWFVNVDTGYVAHLDSHVLHAGDIFIVSRELTHMNKKANNAMENEGDVRSCENSHFRHC